MWVATMNAKKKEKTRKKLPVLVLEKCTQTLISFKIESYESNIL